VRDPLRKALSDGLPAYGSCAGMILLADRVLDGPPDQETLGGIDMTVRRNAFGRQVASFEGDVRMAGLDDRPVHGVFIRAPWVEEVGAAVQVLARVEGGPADGRIVAVRQGSLLATSFHPEITGDGRVHELFVSIVRDSR
jgi:5'-phosphate synthase pdxT subunit